MSLLTSESTELLWQHVLKDAQKDCSVTLENTVESYLISLLIRHTNHPALVGQVFATSLLQALQLNEYQRNYTLQQVGDHCLLYAGLFPEATKRRLVKLNYFVDLGRSAYGRITDKTSHIYHSLALDFVQLMDILQSIRQDQLMPLEAHEQWRLTGSRRALRMIEQYGSSIVPLIRRNK